MKILNVNMSIDPIKGGGTAERTIQLAIYLAKYGVTSSILTSNIDLTDNIKKKLNPVELHLLNCWTSRFHIPRFHFNRIKQIVQNNDIIHLMNHWTPINAVVYLACSIVHKPYVVCPAGALPIYGRSRGLKLLFNALIGQKLIKNADAQIAITSIEREQFIKYNVEPKSVDIIPNGINPKEFESKNDTAFKNRHGIGNDPFFLFVGRLNPIKGPDLLLHAFAAIRDRIPNHRLVYAGPDGGMLPMLRDIARKAGIDNRVHFIGFIGGDEKSWAYHAADLLVVPSRQEAMSIVAIEAGITGTPVVVTDVCGLDQIERIGGGLVVPPTVDGLKEGLLALQNTEQLGTMGNTLKRYVEANYTWDTIIGKHIDLFNRILGSA